ncbi:MAG TPA: hypothetical protein VJH91_03765 [Candidatus Paceibacterota bacterium]
MKRALILISAVVVIGAFGYIATQMDTTKTGEGLYAQYVTYTNSELGIEFDYRAGPSGYVVEEMTPSDASAGLVRTIVLKRTEDKQNEGAIPVGGEGPPTITIHVFENTKKQFPRAWADTHIQYSNMNLSQGDAADAVVGGGSAIRYMSDGLYASENVVVAHGDNVYVITGMFIDVDSDIRRDFGPLVESVRFIPTSGQEQ